MVKIPAIDGSNRRLVPHDNLRSGTRINSTARNGAQIRIPALPVIHRHHSSRRRRLSLEQKSKKRVNRPPAHRVQINGKLTIRARSVRTKQIKPILRVHNLLLLVRA